MAQDVPGAGAVVYGDQGAIQHASHGAGGCVIMPEAKIKEYQPPAKRIPRVPDHYWDWLEVIRAGQEVSSPFEYGRTLTEIALAGAIAIRFLGQELKWYGEEARFMNLAEANAYVGIPFRETLRI